MTQKKNSLWLRTGARFCDYCLLFLILGVISLFLPLFYDPFFYVGVAFTIPFLWIPIEALFLNRWGATFGKFLFGMQIKDDSGKNLSYLSALKRACFIPKRPGSIIVKPTSMKRKILGLFLTLTCFSIGLFGNLLTPWATGINQEMIVAEEGWVKFESDKADFQVYFPHNPTQESKQLILPSTGKVLEYEEISSHKEEDIHYSVTHMNIPRKWKLAGDATLLKLSLESIVKHMPGTELISKQFISHQGHHALEYHLKQEGNTVKGRLIVVGNTMYKLTIVSPIHQETEAETSPFLDSFVANTQ